MYGDMNMHVVYDVDHYCVCEKLQEIVNYSVNTVFFSLEPACIHLHESVPSTII